MKPKGLKFPFKWEERKAALHDGVLFVPQHYDKHDEWVLRKFFDNEGKTFVEYCSGNGDWVINRALQSPGSNWIAVEKRFDRVRKIWSKMRNQNVNNLLIVCGEALTFSRYYLQEGSVAGSFVNFPDPWPKQRQAKHRLIQLPFVEQLERVIERGGEAVFATDDPTYRDQMIEEMQRPLWRSSCDAPYYTTEWDEYGSSWFERLWKEKGRSIFYLNFMKI